MELLIPYLKAFLVGGAFCAVGQVFIDYTKLTPARILVAYVVAGVILGGLGVYQPIIDFAGAGATVPLSGFGALLAMQEEIERNGEIRGTIHRYLIVAEKRGLQQPAKLRTAVPTDV